MKKIMLVIMMILTSILVIGCTSSEIIEETNTVQEIQKDTIATTFFVTDEITQNIVGDKLNVELIIPKGISPHDYEPTPQQLVKLSNSDILVTLGGMFEHIEDEILDTTSNITIVESTHNVEVLMEEEGHDDHYDEEDSHDEHESDEEHHDEEENHEDEHLEEGHDEHGHHDHEDFGYDPHVWLSVKNVILMTKEIEEHLIELYPQHAEEFKANTQAYIKKLESLQGNFTTKLNSCEADVIVVNHKAFGYIAEEFGFEQVSAAGYSHEIEPSIQELEEIIHEAEEHNVSVIFSEGGVNPNLAQTIANEINGQVLPLYPIAVTEEDTYVSIMTENLENLKIGLKCN